MTDERKTQSTEDRHPRGSSWCAELRRMDGRGDGDARICWCGYEIVYEIGQCPECQEDAINDE